MFCKNCGAEIPDGSAFCGNCGMKASAEPVQQEPVNQYASPDPQAYRAEPTSVDAPCACVESKPEPQPQYTQPQYTQPEPQPQYTQPQYTQPEPQSQYTQPQYTQPEPQPQYTQPQYAQPEPPQYNSRPDYIAQPVSPAAPVSATLWIILNILMLLCGCCTVNGILGLIGLIFAVQANNAGKVGDVVTAQKKLKTSKILFFVSLGLLVVSVIVLIILNSAGVIDDLMYQYY